MKTRSNQDPLLGAVLEDGNPGREVAMRDASLAALLVGARRRRRRNALRRWTRTVAVPLLGVGAAWWMHLAATSPPAPAVPRPYILARTEPFPASSVVVTKPDSVRLIRTRGDELRLVSSLDRDTPLEEVTGDDAFLALLPGAAGFIGDGPGQRFVWLAGRQP